MKKKPESKERLQGREGPTKRIRRMAVVSNKLEWLEVTNEKYVCHNSLIHTVQRMAILLLPSRLSSLVFINLFGSHSSLHPKLMLKSPGS
jgi:hypothetical protein